MLGVCESCCNQTEGKGRGRSDDSEDDNLLRDGVEKILITWETKDVIMTQLCLKEQVQVLVMK